MFRWIQVPHSVSPVFSPRKSVAFFHLVLLDPTDGSWSELQIYHVTESFPGLACVCHHSERKPSYTMEAAATALTSFWTYSSWGCDLSPMGLFSCVAVICTSCFSVWLGESPKIVIWIFGSVCRLSTYSSFPTEIWWCVGLSGLCKTSK